MPVAVVPLKSQGAKEKSGLRSAPALPPAAADKSDDRQLLAELKSVINRKFDELMK